MEDPIKFYEKIQDLVRNEAKSVATDVYNTLGTKYNVASVPTHSHNGIDSVQINESVVSLGDKFTSGLVVDTSETFTLRNILRPNHIYINGFAADNAGGGAATERVILNGNIQFGRCYKFSGTGSSIVINTNTVGVPFIQTSNAMFVDSTSLANNRVSVSNDYCVYATDNTGAVVVQMSLDNYSNNSLTFTVTLATNWKLQAAIIIA